MKKILLLSVICLSILNADWIDKTIEFGSKAIDTTKNYSKKVVHNITTDDITFKEYTYPKSNYSINFVID